MKKSRYQHRRHNKNLLIAHLTFVTKYRKKFLTGQFDKDVKQHSACLAWLHHGNMLRNHYWKKQTLWSDGYFVASIGQVSQKAIELYIENQG